MSTLTIVDRLAEAHADLVVAEQYGYPSKDQITRDHYAAAERILRDVIRELRAAPSHVMRGEDVMPLARIYVLQGDDDGAAA